MKVIRIVLVDDDDLILTLLRNLLGREEDIEVVGEASSLEEAVALFRRLKEEGMDVDVAIVDGLEGDGENVANQFKTIFPDGKDIAYSSNQQEWGDENRILKPESNSLPDAVRRQDSLP